mgnify:CR=1 FL=1
MKYGKMICEIEKCIEDGEYSRGEKLAEQAILHKPESPVFYNLMGVILEKECRHVQAMECFKNAYEEERYQDYVRHRERKKAMVADNHFRHVKK